MKSDLDQRARLIGLLRALDDPARAASLDPDDPALLAAARHHRLTPLLSITCGEALPGGLAETCRRDRVVTAARNLMLGQAAEACIRALQAAGVPVIVLKGLDYETRLYGQGGARPAADVDLLVPQSRRRAAFEVLDRLGFEPRAAAPGFDDSDYHEVAWSRGGVEVDLHMALAPLVRCRIDYEAVWRDAVPFRLGDSEPRILSLPHALIFQALHMAIDHFQVPAIYLMDLARLWSRGIDADQLKALSPLAIAQGKSAVYTAEDVDLATARRTGLEALTLLINSPDWAEGMGAFMEKRAPKFG